MYKFIIPKVWTFNKLAIHKTVESNNKKKVAMCVPLCYTAGKVVTVISSEGQ